MPCNSCLIFSRYREDSQLTIYMAFIGDLQMSSVCLSILPVYQLEVLCFPFIVLNECSSIGKADRLFWLPLENIV